MLGNVSVSVYVTEGRRCVCVCVCGVRACHWGLRFCSKVLISYFQANLTIAGQTVSVSVCAKNVIFH